MRLSYNNGDVDDVLLDDRLSFRQNMKLLDKIRESPVNDFYVFYEGKALDLDIPLMDFHIQQYICVDIYRKGQSIP